MRSATNEIEYKCAGRQCAIAARSMHALKYCGSCASALLVHVLQLLLPAKLFSVEGSNPPLQEFVPDVLAGRHI